MPRQESTTVVSVPLATLETRLSDVEQWPQFLVGLTRVERLGHGRYRFHVASGATTHDLPVALTKDAREHRFSWHCLEGPKWDGELRLTATDDGHTRVRLTTVTEPRGFVANVADWVSSHKDEATIDLQRLEALVGG